MVVRMRANRAHRDNRRAHHALEKARFSACKNCNTLKISHRACPNCGMYRDLKVVDVQKKITKKEKKQKEKATAK